MNKILIIDDDRELCALIKRSVQAEHIEADFCNTGKEGLQKLKEQEYQLVVLDVMMPDMDGFETLEEIRKENSLPILMFKITCHPIFRSCIRSFKSRSLFLSIFSFQNSVLVFGKT